MRLLETCGVISHRIPAWQGLEGTSVGHPTRPPAQAGSPRAGCTAPRPGGAGISPEKETPQPPCASVCAQTYFLKCRVVEGKVSAQSLSLLVMAAAWNAVVYVWPPASKVALLWESAQRDRAGIRTSLCGHSLLVFRCFFWRLPWCFIRAGEGASHEPAAECRPSFPQPGCV